MNSFWSYHVRGNLANSTWRKSAKEDLTNRVKLRDKLGKNYVDLGRPREEKKKETRWNGDLLREIFVSEWAPDSQDPRPHQLLVCSSTRRSVASRGFHFCFLFFVGIFSFFLSFFLPSPSYSYNPPSISLPRSVIVGDCPPRWIVRRKLGTTTPAVTRRSSPVRSSLPELGKTR